MSIIETIKAEVERLKEEHKEPTFRGDEYEEGGLNGYQLALDKVLAKLDTLQEKSEKPINPKPMMIEWTGNNLKEVIEFTGKSPRFDEWFKTWDEYESYVHSHGNILKLFNKDGTHLEVPVGAWIFKTPDGWNVPSTFLLPRATVKKDNPLFDSCLAKVNPETREEVRKNIDKMIEQPVCEGLEEEIERYLHSLGVGYGGWVDGMEDDDLRSIARHFAKWQKEQDTRDMYMSDNRHFQKVYELGKKDMKEQMMKEAVEGCICGGPCRENWWMETPLNVIPAGLHVKPGDNVKVIIIEGGHDFE